MEQYFIANDIPKAKKVAAFLSAYGAKAYKLLCNLVVPDSPKDKRFNDLVKTLLAYLKPKPLVIAERLKFSQENVTQRRECVRAHCNFEKFGNTCDFGTFLNDALLNCHYVSVLVRNAC